MVEVRAIESWMKRCAWSALFVTTLLCSGSQAQTSKHISSSLRSCDSDRDSFSAGESCDDFTPSSAVEMPLLVPALPHLRQDQQAVSHPKVVTGYRVTKKFLIPDEGG